MLIPVRAGTGGELRKGLFGAGERTDERYEHVITILFLPRTEQAARASFLSELLLYKERSCLRARILELPPARHPAGLCFSQASRDTHAHQGLVCILRKPCPAHFAAAPYGHQSMSQLLLWPQESIWRMLPVANSKSRTEDLQAASSRQNQIEPRPMAQTLS